MQTVREHGTNSAEARKYFVFRSQVIRGACILAVIAFHICPLGSRLLSFCVPVFVLISGFHLSLSPRNERPLGFYRRTLKFLLVPYLVYSFVYGIPHMIRGATVAELWRDFLSSNIEAHLWFMPMILGLYVLHPWLRRLGRRSLVGTCMAAITLQLWVWPWIKSHGLPEGAATTLLSFMAELGYFVVGYFLLDNAVAVRRVCEHRVGRVASIVIWLLWPALGLSRATRGLEGPLVKLLMLASHLAAFCLLAGMSRPASRVGHMVAGWVGRFGLYSYGIYLLHPLVVSIVSLVMTCAAGLNPEGTLWCTLVFAATASTTLFATRWLANRPGGRYVT